MSQSEEEFNKINVDDITFTYDGSEIILDGVKLEIDKPEIVGIIGPNGSGKTTLIKCINNILAPIQGKILLGGEELKNYKMGEIAKKMAYVPQNTEKDMNSPNVYEVVLMGRRPHSVWQYSEYDTELVWKIMTEMDVAHLASHRFDELSSGQLQRVLISRAIAQEAKIFLLDEPTSNLDVKYQIEVMNIVNKIVKENNVGACVIIHDLDLAYRFCDKIIMMGDKKVQFTGTPDDVMTSENIYKIFGVESVIHEINGKNHVIII